MSGRKPSSDYSKLLKKKEHYPIFTRCAIFVKKLDDFWGDRLLELSRNIMPKGIKYENRCLTFSKKNKSLDLSIYDDDGEMAYDIIDFIKEHACVYSDKDKKKNKKTEDLLNEERARIDLTWSSASKKDRKTLIIIFIREESERLELSLEEKEEFSNFLKRGFKDGRIPDNNINLENNTIVSIDCLKFDEDTREFDLPSSTTKTFRSYSRPKENANLDKDSYISLKKKEAELIAKFISRSNNRKKNISSSGM